MAQRSTDQPEARSEQQRGEEDQGRRRNHWDAQSTALDHELRVERVFLENER